MIVGSWGLERNCFFFFSVKSALGWVTKAIENTRKCWRQVICDRALTCPAAEVEFIRMPTLVSISGFVIADYNFLLKSLHKKETRAMGRQPSSMSVRLLGRTLHISQCWRTNSENTFQESLKKKQLLITTRYLCGLGFSVIFFILNSAKNGTLCLNLMNVSQGRGKRRKCNYFLKNKITHLLCHGS